MRSARFIAIVLASGAMAGLVFGSTSSILAGPYLEGAVMLEAQGIARAGVPNEDAFWAGYAEYRGWQGGGALLASVVLGCAFAAMYGLVYLLYGRHVPGATNRTKEFALAGAMWLALYIVPIAKYPPGLPGDGDPATLDMRIALHVTIVLISGISAICLHRASVGASGIKKAPFAAAWVTIVITAVVLMPSSPDTAMSSQSSIDAFRATSAIAVTAYWVALPAIFGAFWRRYGHDVHMRAPRG